MRRVIYIMRSSSFKAAYERQGFPRYIASLSLGKLSWNTTKIWCHFIFLCDQNRHIRFNSIQSLQYLHLFTCTC